ncbi:MAG: hypothetical protein PHF25_03885 [Candidatus Margulisbacteria bacterium]|nr:hypothetical protein [Candidatus Margulisiibacteriota bacterium]
MEIGSINISNTPHIQIDSRREEKDLDRPNFKDFLPNPDVTIINRSEEVRDGAAVVNEVNENKIILNQYRTTYNLLLGQKESFIKEVNLMLGESGRTYLHTFNEDVPSKNEMLDRIIPESFKKRVLGWALNYKLYVVVEMLNPNFSIEHKKQVRNIYLNNVKQVLAYSFHDVHWAQVVDDIRESIRSTEIVYYEKKLITLKQKIVKIGETVNQRERMQALSMTNKYIAEFASNYYTGTFPVNDHSMDRLKQLVEYINKQHAMHLEIV